MMLVVNTLLGIALRREVRRAAEEVCDYLEKATQRQILELAKRDVDILASPEAAQAIRERVRRAYLIAAKRGVAEQVLAAMKRLDPKLMVRLIAEEAVDRAEEGNPTAWRNLQYISRNAVAKKWLAKQIVAAKKLIINEWEKFVGEGR